MLRMFLKEPVQVLLLISLFEFCDINCLLTNSSFRQFFFFCFYRFKFRTAVPFVFVDIATSLHYIHDHEQSVHNILEHNYDKTYTIKFIVITFTSISLVWEVMLSKRLEVFFDFRLKKTATTTSHFSMPINNRHPSLEYSPLTSV